MYMSDQDFFIQGLFVRVQAVLSEIFKQSDYDQRGQVRSELWDKLNNTDSLERHRGIYLKACWLSHLETKEKQVKSLQVNLVSI